MSWSRQVRSSLIVLALSCLMLLALAGLVSAQVPASPFTSSASSSSFITVALQPVTALAAPELQVNKNNSNGAAQPGGVVGYQLQVYNNGNGDALNTLITDTLPLSTTWAGDTSGVTPLIGAEGVITWNLGTLPGGANRVFQVTLHVGADVVGQIGPNCAGVTSASPGDWNEGNNFACAGPVNVQTSDVEVGAKTWAEPSDPAPGEEFDSILQVCNNRGVMVGPVWLTSTLPTSTTLLSWRPDDSNQNLWNEISRDNGQLVLVAPGLPANCDQVRVRLRVNTGTPLGTVLVSAAVIGVAGDVDLSNQQNQYTAYVSGPRTDLEVDKWIDDNILAPGGQIHYHLWYANRSNTALHAFFTDTLPVSVTYRAGSATRQGGGAPVPPLSATAQSVVWDLGTLAIGETNGINFYVDVDSAVIPNTVLTNCVAIASSPTTIEDTPWNNTKCSVETIYAHGPNLRINKWARWNPGDSAIRYEVRFENIGDLELNDVWITDVLPISTTYEGWFKLGFDWNRLISNTANNNVLRWEFSTLYPGDSGGLNFNAQMDYPNLRPLVYTNSIEIRSPSADLTPGDNAAEAVTPNGEVTQVDLRVGAERFDAWGRAEPNSVVTMTTAAYQATTNVDPWGNWNMNDNGGTFNPGDVVTVTAGRGLQPIALHVPAPFEAQAASSTDQVWGQIDTLNHALIDVDVYGYLNTTAQTDSTGHFTRTLSSLPRGRDGEVRYATRVAGADVVFHRNYNLLDLLLRVNYGEGWVEGNYEPGHTVWLTVTNSSGVFKGGAVLSTTVIGWWNGQTGFSTNQGGWTSGQPDIQPGDWVYGLTETGYTSTVHVGTITRDVNLGTDIVSGTITANWFTAPLNGNCSVWETNGPGIDFTVDPNGGSYICNFHNIWNIVPGQTIGVQYQDLDGNEVINSIRTPAPDMNVQKWVEGNKDIALDSLIVFGLQYQNNGTASGHAILTDTLPTLTTYVTDTSGLPATINGKFITWDLGTVEPYTIPHRFQVVLSHTATASNTLNNMVDIDALYDTNLGNNHAEASVHIREVGQPDLYINKSASPGDPAPGQLFRYDLNYGNNSSLGSGQACISDTLPLSTSLVSWQSQNGYNLWTQVSLIDRQLTLCAPVVPGEFGDQIQLTVQVDANIPIDTQLVNTVEITTTNDEDLGNNLFTNSGTRVGWPRFNVRLDKNWGYGATTPGQEINYNLDVYNGGNSVIHNTIVTDTLPDHTIFVAAYRDLGWGIQVPLTPTRQLGQQIAWNLDALAVNDGRNLVVKVRIASDTASGTVLNNCATATISDFETYLHDNADCLAETVRAPGTNLRVVKTARWQGTDRIHYDIAIDNIGTTTVETITLTDTFPVSGSLNGWNLNYWEGWQGNVSGNQLVITLQRLQPNSTAWLRMDVQVPPVPNGTFFTNTVEVTIPPDDVYPADNTDVAVVGTGPDLFVEKSLMGGLAAPGQLLTYTLYVENDSPWDTSGQVWITDVLPAKVSFVKASWRDCGGQYFCAAPPDASSDRTLAWNYDKMCPGCGNDLVVTVRVTDTVGLTDWLTNTAQIASNDPVNDVEPYTTNNLSVLALSLARPQFTIGKAAQTNRVAGTVVTYTLTVTNVGTYTGTNITLIDQIPANLTPGGTFSWPLASLAPDNGTASVGFSRTLSCSAGGAVNNTQYRVISSDQAVTTTDGLPVNFVIAAPTINADFNRTPDPILAGQTLTFTGTASTDGLPLNSAWNFDDGAQATGLNATHAYTRSGTYTVVFTATDGCGFVSTQTHLITVNAPTLAANFTQSATSIIVNSTVRFTDTSTTNGPSIVGWRWTFGDGGLSSAQHPTHTYTTVGVYTVTLLITDSLGYTATHAVPKALTIQSYQVYLPLMARNH